MVTLTELPETLAEYQNLRAAHPLTDPENTCALFLAALHLFTLDRAAGTEAVNLLCGPRPLTQAGAQFLRDRLMDKTYLPMVYFEGATPENNYTPNEPLTLTLHPDTRPQDCEEGYFRLEFLAPAFDAPRRITLRRKGEEWFLWEYSSLLTGVRTPVADDPWA